MKRGSKSSVPAAGFTIVETMIVLAVTGLLFVAIASTWFGRQNKTEFQTSAQEIRSRIQQVISDVQNGYFPNQDNFSCNVNSNAVQLTHGDGNNKPQGTNYPCVFLGKVIQFHFANTDPELYRVYTVAADGGQTDIAASHPKLVAPSTTPPSAPGNDFPPNYDSNTLSNGLSLRAYKIDGGKVKVPSAGDIAVGFFSSLGQLGQDGVYASGSQQVNLYALREASVPASDPASKAPDLINVVLQLDDPSKYEVNKPTALCFQSGGTNQYAVVTIGQGASQLTADLSIRNGTCDADF